jgi:hypothetical protein
VVLFCLGAAASAAGQTIMTTGAAPASGMTFLPRAGFTFTWGSLATPDLRFDWLGQTGIDLDVVDYGAGRVRFQGSVEGGLGRERRRYDLNHGNFAFDASMSYRVAREVEVEAVIQHVSRHVIDRENPPAVSWNASGVRLQYRSAGSRRRQNVEARAELLYVTQPAFVDYTWIARGAATYRAPLSARLGAFAIASGDVTGVDEDLRGSSRVCGGRLEAGLRIRGEAAALELFIGYERRIDAFPTDRFRVRWVTAGFRIVGG